MRHCGRTGKGLEADDQQHSRAAAEAQNNAAGAERRAEVQKQKATIPAGPLLPPPSPPKRSPHLFSCRRSYSIAASSASGDIDLSRVVNIFLLFEKINSPWPLQPSVPRGTSQFEWRSEIRAAGIFLKIKIL